jgi:hypothetical protein
MSAINPITSCYLLAETERPALACCKPARRLSNSCRIGLVRLSKNAGTASKSYWILPREAPEHTTVEVFPRYINGEVLADSAALNWPGLFARRYRFPRVVDGFLVPATAEPMIACNLNGSAEFQERDIGGAWVPRMVRRGDIFVTGSKTPYELRWRSPLGAHLDVIHIHLGVGQCQAAFEIVYGDKAAAIEVTEFFGRDEALTQLSLACVGNAICPNCG